MSIEEERDDFVRHLREIEAALDELFKNDEALNLLLDTIAEEIPDPAGRLDECRERIRYLRKLAERIKPD